MSFGGYARRVRNAELPYGRRRTSLRCAVERYMPLGFNATWDYITDRAGDVRTDEAALLRALESLETSRAADLAEMAAFALRRTAEKRDRRSPSPEERAYRYGWRWPGPDAHEATRHTVQALWRRHERLPFPNVRPADKAHLVMLDSTVAGCVSMYLSGALDSIHRDILRRCVADLRDVWLDHALPFPEAFTYVRRLRKMAELVARDTLPLVRRAWQGDAERISEVLVTARDRMGGLPHPQPHPYGDEETRAWIGGVVLPRREVWVAELQGRVAGFVTLNGHRLEQLYVTPDTQGRGLGSALLARAKKVRPDLLGVTASPQNAGARRFYEKHGFSLMAVEGGSGDEDRLPAARYHWRGIDEAPRPEPLAVDDSLTCAFPNALADDVRAVVGIMPATEHRPMSAFQVTVGEERVTLPERIYLPDVAPERLLALSPLQRQIAHCLYTRHHNGFVRQRHLAHVVGSLDPWVLPYVVRLAGEYVMEIVSDIDDALSDLDRPGTPTHAAYGRFIADNPDFLELTAQRAVSYWACYHRTLFPRLQQYPGHRLMAALKAAAATRT